MSFSISSTTLKKTLYSGASAMFALGFYRGCEQYQYKNQKSTLNVDDFVHMTCFGVLNASIYVNPVLSVFALSDEYHKIKMLMSEEFDEHKYYSSSFFNEFE